MYRKALQKESREALFQLVLPAVHMVTTLKVYNGEIGHLGLEPMLDLMCECFFWPYKAAQVKKHVD